ncbi:FUSC family protein [Microbaculum marinum]|uniref:FUSC family protein n=1 Tax=Microbaculum marinum TaxID=1764581 RepID=A0AAW9S223_9HYPH
MSSAAGSAFRIRPSTRLAIQAAVSALLAIAIVNIVALDRPYWVILTAVVVMVGSTGETLAKSVDRTVGTLIGLVAGLAIYWLAVLVAFPTVALLILTVPSVVFFKFANYRLMVMAITASVVLLLELSDAPQTLILARLLDTAIGAALAVATSFLILRIPTRRPVMETIDTYTKALADMVHDALQGIIECRWSPAIDEKAATLRRSDEDFDRLAAALHVESALVGGGDDARTALAILPVLRGHVENIVDAAEAAAQSGIGRDTAGELRKIDALIAANLDAVRDALLTGKPQDLPLLEPYYRSIEAELLPKLRDPDTWQDVVSLMNVLLAVRRLNRGLRHTMSLLGK